eukprot:TRINITY_DN1800_c0_g1_i1.p1 TRINITY_DN1800_c0_g1~~TRINITY_DN1800_c0_g1_i1.p1  ORF type:complete len:597 (+),score=83.97 TRINITY_DN1800_c0_g1_i1:937-2727(+)
MEEIQYETIERLATMLHSENYEESKQAIEVLSGVQISLEKIVSFLGENCSDYVVVFLLQMLRETLLEEYQKVDGDFEVVLSLLERVYYARCAQDARIRVILAGCYARVMHLLWLGLRDENLFLKPLDKFIGGTAQEQIFYFLVLNQLIEDNCNSSSFNIKRLRHLSFIFRDNFFDVLFKNSLNAVLNSEDVDLKNCALNSALSIVKYNYRSSGNDESLDYIGTIELPLMLRKLIVEENVIEQLFNIYSYIDLECKPKVLEILSWLSSLKYLTIPPEECKIYLNSFLSGIISIIRSGSVKNDECHHRFAILLAKFCTNFSVGMLLKSEFFNQTLSYIYDYSLNTYSISNLNSSYYINVFWAKMAMGYCRYSKQSSSISTINIIKDYSFDIFKCYMDSQFTKIQNPVSVDEELLDQEIQSVLKNLSIIGKVNCFNSGEELIKNISELGNMLSNDSENVYSAKCLSWCILILSYYVSDQTTNDPNVDRRNIQLMDARLLGSVFKIIFACESGSLFQNPTEVTYFIEYSICVFLVQFCKIFFRDEIMVRTDIFTIAFEGSGITPNDLCDLIMKKIIKMLNLFPDDESIIEMILGRNGLFF